jgi:hypothetical protein
MHNSLMIIPVGISLLLIRPIVTAVSAVGSLSKDVLYILDSKSLWSPAEGVALIRASDIRRLIVRRNMEPRRRTVPLCQLYATLRTDKMILIYQNYRSRSDRVVELARALSVRWSAELYVTDDAQEPARKWFPREFWGRNGQ